MIERNINREVNAEDNVSMVRAFVIEKGQRIDVGESKFTSDREPSYSVEIILQDFVMSSKIVTGEQLHFETNIGVSDVGEVDGIECLSEGALKVTLICKYLK